MGRTVIYPLTVPEASTRENLSLLLVVIAVVVFSGVIAAILSDAVLKRDQYASPLRKKTTRVIIFTITTLVTGVVTISAYPLLKPEPRNPTISAFAMETYAVNAAADFTSRATGEIIVPQDLHREGTRITLQNKEDFCSVSVARDSDSIMVTYTPNCKVRPKEPLSPTVENKN